MSISKIAMLTFGMAILASSVLISNPVYAPNHDQGGTFPTSCEDCFFDLQTCELNAGSNQIAYDLCYANFFDCKVLFCPVGGLPLPINESEVFGELAKQYSLWLIPSISAIGIAAFLIKRKL